MAAWSAAGAVTTSSIAPGQSCAAAASTIARTLARGSPASTATMLTSTSDERTDLLLERRGGRVGTGARAGGEALVVGRGSIEGVAPRVERRVACEQQPV